MDVSRQAFRSVSLSHDSSVKKPSRPIFQVKVGFTNAKLEFLHEPFESWLIAQRKCLQPCVDELLLREERLQLLGKLSQENKEAVYKHAFKRFRER